MRAAAARIPVQGCSPQIFRCLASLPDPTYDIQSNLYIMEGAVQVAKWGNSLAVRLPKKIVAELGLKAGDEVNLVAAGKKALEVEKHDRRAEFLEQIRDFRFPLPADYRF